MFFDCYALKEKFTGTEEADHRNERLSDLVLFVPFSALLYTENFWVNLACTLPVILAVAATQWACRTKDWLDNPPEVITLAPGSYLLAVVGYFIFFHEGFLADPDPTTPPVSVEAPEATEFWLGFWPYAIYLVCFLFTITRKSTDGISLSVLLLILVVTILPFFTGYYWWAMLVGFCMLLITVHRAFKVLESGSAGAFSLVSSFFYMMAAFGSVLIYAILF